MFGRVKGSFQLLFWIVMLSAVAVRVVWMLLVPVDPVSDSHAYDVFARNIALHDNYGWTPTEQSAYWPVGTSAIYGGLYKVFGISYIPISIVNLIAGLAIIVLTMLLARNWFGEQTALFAGVLLAFWPGQIMFTTIMASELMFTALMLASLLTLEADEYGVRHSLIAGGLIAVAVYLRPIALLFPFLFALALWNRLHSLRLTSIHFLVILIFLSVAIAPWSLRNTKLYGEFTLMSTNAGAVLWMGNNPDTTGAYQPLPTDVNGLGEYEREKFLKQRAINHIKSNPVGFLFRAAKKAVRLYECDTIGVHWNVNSLTRLVGDTGVFIAKLISQVFWVCALILCLYGITLMLRESGPALLVHPAMLIPLYITGIHAVFIFQDRYHYPAVPFIAIFAGITLGRLFKKNDEQLGETD